MDKLIYFNMESIILNFGNFGYVWNDGWNDNDVGDANECIMDKTIFLKNGEINHCILWGGILYKVGDRSKFLGNIGDNIIGEKYWR